MFDAKVCEIICIGLKVMLKNVPRNVAKTFNTFQTFLLDCKFQSDHEKIYAII